MPATKTAAAKGSTVTRNNGRWIVTGVRKGLIRILGEDEDTGMWKHEGHWVEASKYEVAT